MTVLLQNIFLPFSDNEHIQIFIRY